MLNGGTFVESVEKCVRLPTIRSIILQHIVEFMKATAANTSLTTTKFERIHPFSSYSDGIVPISLWIELLMSAHFLDLPQLMVACCRDMADRFLGL
jgi:hypothetical protein